MKELVVAPELIILDAGMLHTTKPEFKWTVSVGTITQGQGTDEITVNTAGLAYSIRHLFGTAYCPQCGNKLVVNEAISLMEFLRR